MSDSVRPHRQKPTRLPHPWDSPGKNTGVGCHFLLQCMKVKSESEVSQLCLTLGDPMNYSLPGSSIHGIFQARVLEWGAIAFSPHHVILYFSPTCLTFTSVVKISHLHSSLKCPHFTAVGWTGFCLIPRPPLGGSAAWLAPWTQHSQWLVPSSV